MLARTPIVAFVPTARPDEARQFYRDVLGLPLRHEDDFALVFDANGTPLRVAKVEQLDPAGYTILGWTVDDIESALRELTRHGVATERFGFLEQDAAGIWTTPGGDRVAWFRDPDGNTLSLTQLIH